MRCIGIIVASTLAFATAAHAHRGVVEEQRQAAPKPAPEVRLEDFVDGLTTPLPKVVRERPRLIKGTLSIGAVRMPFASGGGRIAKKEVGWSIPYGSYPITPNEVGNWGKRHGAIGVNGNTIHDKQLGRDREGIEIHASNAFASAGCLVVRQFDELRRAIFGMIKRSGTAWLHVGPSAAAITPTRTSPLPFVVYVPERQRPERRVAHHAPPRPHAHRHAHHHRHARRYART